MFSETITDFGSLLRVLVIVCPLVFAAGFVDSIAGGGGVISLPSYLIAGIPIKFAAGTNKFANSFGTGLASYKYFKSGNVDFKAAIPAAIGALAGSAIGANLTVYLPDSVVSMIVLIALPIAAVLMAFSGRLKKQGEKKRSGAATVMISVLTGLVLGCYDGLIGPGTGAFLTIAFNVVLGYPLIKASGCARVVNLTSNVVSLIVYLINGKILYIVGIPAMFCSMLGGYLGSGFAIKGGSGRIKIVMFIVLALLFIKMILNMLGIVDW